MLIMREAAKAYRRPVLLFSAGKDSAVILRLAEKAFAPSLPPFPLLHVDTTWKFPETYEFRDRTAAEAGVKLIVHVNRGGVARGIGPFSHGAETHVRIMKSEALQSALDRYGFDVMIDGARGDEERFRSDSRLSDAAPRPRRGKPRVPAAQLDRDGCLALRSDAKHTFADALLRRTAAGGTTERNADRQGGPANDAGARRETQHAEGAVPHAGLLAIDGRRGIGGGGCRRSSARTSPRPDSGALLARNRPAGRPRWEGAAPSMKAAPMNRRSASTASAGRESRFREARKPCMLWLTGLPAAGKTTLAREIARRLEALGVRAFVLDGDDLRLGLNSDLGFSHAARNESVRRAGHAARLLVDSGTIAVVALISPFRKHRQRIRALAGDGRFMEIFVDAPLHVCERRDPKGLYASARGRRYPGLHGHRFPLRTAREPGDPAQVGGTATGRTGRRSDPLP